jgi:hypothetical protein
MGEKYDGGPAFPRPSADHGSYGSCEQDGMSLRDWFAGQAVGSVMHMCAGDTLLPGESIETSFARKAYAVADAMLAERERTK